MSKSYREPRIKVVQKSEHEFQMFFDDETEREMEEIKSKVKKAFSIPLKEYQYNDLINSIIAFFFTYDDDMVALEDLLSDINELLDILIYYLFGGGAAEQYNAVSTENQE